MKKSTIILSLLFLLMSKESLLSQNFNAALYKPYEGKDLGVTYTQEMTTIKVWSPTADIVKVKLYGSSKDAEAAETATMLRGENGIWSISLKGNQANKYYTIVSYIGGKVQKEVPDPYAKAVGANGKRGMIVDFNATNPADWQKDKSPRLKAANDAIIYELHVRDATIASNAKSKGKFLGLTETGLKNSAGQSVGLDHIKELGVTHVHLLPFFDFASIDETSDRPKYNWGYDPLNYNALEGSYSTNALNGATRINEFKQMVKAFHDNGISVVMDVVYNHVNSVEQFSFQQLVPNYFFRQTADGKLSNASACGNETASERPMVRKFIIESLLHWMNEYHIDGFRFDLMAIHDIETMNEIATTLRTVRPDILLYGEGWTAGDSPLPEKDRSLKKYAYRLNDIAVFSDDMRDGIKGSVFEHQDKGFVSGKSGMEASIKFGIVGGVKHPQIDNQKVIYSKEAYCAKPTQFIAYAECHDNHTLWDRLLNSNPDASEEERIRMFLLAETIVLTSQGTPFIHAGAEFCRTKAGVENSFESPDDINKMDWERKKNFVPVFEYLKQMIAFRKAHPAFRMPTQEMVAKHLTFIDNAPANTVAYTITGKPNGEKFKQILVVYNANTTAIELALPKGKWRVALDQLQWETPSNKRSVTQKLSVAPQSATILYIK